MDMHRLLTVAIFKTAYKNKHSFHSHSLRCFLKQLAILNGNIKKNVLAHSVADNIVVYKSGEAPLKYICFIAISYTHFSVMLNGYEKFTIKGT